MAIKKGIPMRAPRKTVSSSNSSTHQCINVTLLLETLLKNQQNTNLNNNRFRILPVSIKKKEREIIPEVINHSFGRGKRSASAAITTTTTTTNNTRRVPTTVDSKRPRGRKTVESNSTSSTSPVRSYYNNNAGGSGGSSMIRSSSAAASHHRHLEDHIPSPLARSFSVGLGDGEETSTNSNYNKSNNVSKSLTTTGRIVSQRPNHFNDYEMAYVS